MHAVVRSIRINCSMLLNTTLDHASWRKLGFPSAFTIESEFDNSNPYIHTTRDVIENLSFDHMKEFAKVAVGFAVELSHVRD